MTKPIAIAPLDAALKHIATLVGQARDRSFRAANTELVHLYWSVGQYLSQQCQHKGWGQGTVKTLAQLLQTREPGWKGFSAQNLWRMKQFFEAYEGDEELSTRLSELPWSANLHLLSKCKSRQERAFYLQWMLQEGWSVRQLAQQIDSALFTRVAASPAKLSTALRVLHPGAAQVFDGSYRLGADAIQVMTMKGSKGLEFPVLALPGVGHMPAPGEDEKDAARVFYVAATRATQRLVMGVGGKWQRRRKLIG